MKKLVKRVEQANSILNTIAVLIFIVSILMLLGAYTEVGGITSATIIMCLGGIVLALCFYVSGVVVNILGQIAQDVNKLANKQE